MSDGEKQIIKDIYINEIMDYLYRGTAIPEDMMYLFCQKTLELVHGRYYPNAVTERAKDFCLYMSHLWSSQSYTLKNCDSTFIFQVGELHYCARILDDYFSEIEKQKSIEEDSQFDEDIKRYITKIGFFSAISENPGIKHSILADRIGISKSYLSQFAAKIKNRGYHYERIAGREKYYYLTDAGIQLLKSMKDTLSYNCSVALQKPQQKQLACCFSDHSSSKIVLSLSKMPKDSFGNDYQKALPKKFIIPTACLSLSKPISFDSVDASVDALKKYKALLNNKSQDANSYISSSIQGNKFEKKTELNETTEDKDYIMQTYEESDVCSDGFDEKLIPDNEMAY